MAMHPEKPKGTKQRPGKGGKQSALIEYQMLSDQKALAKLRDILSLRYGKYSEFENAKSLIDSYLKALDFQSDRSAGSHVAIGPECASELGGIHLKAIGFYSLNMVVLTWAGDLAHKLMLEYLSRQMPGNVMFSIPLTPMKVFGSSHQRQPNPHELKDWLAMPQAQKGYDMKIIVYGVRYLDLRKFRYEPSEEFVFKGVSTPLRLPVSGLDEGNGISPNFKFVHPVLALKDRNRFALDDVNLEARDCLTLWKHMKETISSALLRDAAQLDPINTLPYLIEKAHVIEWEKNLKNVLKRAMGMQDPSFTDLQKSLDVEKNTNQPTRTLERDIKKLCPLACELHAQNALPAPVFDYDRFECEQAIKHILQTLQKAKDAFKREDKGWKHKVQAFEKWGKATDNGHGINQSNTVEEICSKLDLVREEASLEINAWESFDPEAPLDQFSFAGKKTVQQAEFSNLVRSLSGNKVAPWLIDALHHGLGVHHAGMNRRYRQVLKGVISAKDDFELDVLDEEDRDGDDPGASFGETEGQKSAETVESVVKVSAKGKAKIKVADSWDDDSEESELEGIDACTVNTSEAAQPDLNRQDGLMLVLKAFKLLEANFGAKFYNIGV
ncbi:dead deah box helicase [Fusarium beomiforme]|uniref:Dead deah box helicase n=1 Tax=Fusarium beomiforme TaxID=44412 RepID=A0A9P5DZP8_9HYPO|nr:dead deah box helicase [Fusarium beomiforme]